MDSWADLCADQEFLSQAGGPGTTARIQDPHMGPIHTYVRIHACMHTYIHTHVQTGTLCMFMHRQTDRHTCTCIDGKLKYIQINRNCIIMYRDNVRNIHEIIWPYRDQVFQWISKNGVGGEHGSAKFCLYMHANAQTFWLNHR